MEHICFPDEGAVSVVVAISDGAAIEAGMIGQEGVVGTEAICGVLLFAEPTCVEV